MPIERVDVLDHKAFGEMVVGWALDPDTRPKTLDELKEACVDILSIPNRIKKLRYVNDDLKTLRIRVPHKQMMEESKARFSGENARTSGGYPAPGFYSQVGAVNQPPDLDIMYSRIADYVIAQCA